MSILHMSVASFGQQMLGSEKPALSSAVFEAKVRVDLIKLFGINLLLLFSNLNHFINKQVCCIAMK